MKKIIINQNDQDQRIDNFLVKVFPKLSRTMIYKALRNKRIKVNNKKVEHNYRLQLNDELCLYINDEFLEKPNNQDFLVSKNDLDIVYEDYNVLVVNKPVGLVVHEDNNNSVDTLINRVKKYLYSSQQWDPANENSFTPSLGHRLDRNTAGLIMIAKNAVALKSLENAFRNLEVKKHYLALVQGLLDFNEKYTIKLFLEDDESGLVKVHEMSKNNTKEAITKFIVLRHIANKYSLVDVELITGRKHQIRASFNWLGFPLVGEKKYTSADSDRDKRFKYQCLVSYKLQLNIKDQNDPLFYLNKKHFELKKIWFLEKLH